MAIDFDALALSGAARRVLADDAPKPARMMAARGAVPGTRPAELVVVLALLAERGDETSEIAAQTLAKLPAPVLQTSLAEALPAVAIAALAKLRASDEDVLMALVAMATIDDATLVALAESATELLGERIATNEERMLRTPAVIEALYMNKRVRMSTADRLIELAVRNGVELKIPAFKEAAAAIQNELIPEPSDEPTYDDQIFREVTELAEQVQLAEDEDVVQRVLPDGTEASEEDEEVEERVVGKVLPLHAAIAAMTITQKIRKAMLGTSAERLLLIRDSNKLVAEAAAKSPRMRDNEAILVSSSRSVSDSVLRIIAGNRELTRSYRVKVNLVSNPRTPFTFALHFISHLRTTELRMLARSKNVPTQVARAAQRALMSKQ